jgi:hypothetical protein
MCPLGLCARSRLEQAAAVPRLRTGAATCDGSSCCSADDEDAAPAVKLIERKKGVSAGHDMGQGGRPLHQQQKDGIILSLFLLLLLLNGAACLRKNVIALQVTCAFRYPLTHSKINSFQTAHHFKFVQPFSGHTGTIKGCKASLDPRHLHKTGVHRPYRTPVLCRCTPPLQDTGARIEAQQTQEHRLAMWTSAKVHGKLLRS